MNTLRQAVQEYLSMRRNLGFQLRETGKGLCDFVTFMEQHRAPSITVALALDCVLFIVIFQIQLTKAIVQVCFFRIELRCDFQQIDPCRGPTDIC